MNPTRSLDELRTRIEAPRRRGLAVELVYADYSAGCTRLLRGMMQDTACSAGPRVIAASAAYGDWDCIVTLSRLAKTAGASQTDRLVKALRALCGGGTRPLSIVVEDARFMGARGMEAFTLCLENATAETGLSARLFLMLKQYKYWHQKIEKAKDGSQYWGGAWEASVDWPPLPALFLERQKTGALQISELKRQGLDVLSRTEAREEITERLAISA